jgi:hypothetical protein
MSPIQAGITDRFGRAYQSGARIVYPTRRGSTMELIEATVIGTATTDGDFTVVFARRSNGTKVTLRNLWDAVVVPR